LGGDVILLLVVHLTTLCYCEKQLSGAGLSGGFDLVPVVDSSDRNFDYVIQDPVFLGPMADDPLIFTFRRVERPPTARDETHYVTACQQELGMDGNGRYPRVISQQFMTGIINSSGDTKNLNCKCVESEKMECTITVRFKSLEHEIVRRRIGSFSSRPPADKLTPFFIIPEYSGIFGSALINNLYFKHTLCYPPVIAEINVAINKLPPQIQRSQSAPALWHYSFRSIRQSLCTDGSSNGVCPITQEDFRDNTIVYVLKTDKLKVEEKKAVVCISAEGLRSLMQTSGSDDKSFRDPLNREGGSLLKLEDYIPYVIFEDDPRKCNRAIQTESLSQESRIPTKRATPGKVIQRGRSEPMMVSKPSFADISALEAVQKKPSSGSPSQALSSSSAESSNAPLVFQHMPALKRASFTGVEKGSQTHEQFVSQKYFLSTTFQHHQLLKSLISFTFFTSIFCILYKNIFKNKEDAYIALI